MKKKALVVLLLVVMLVGTFATFSYGADKKTGLYKEDGKWKYFEDGKFKPISGLVQRPDTKTWHYVEDGIYKKSTGLVQCVQPGSSKGKWYYVEKGDLSKTATGLVKCIQPGSSLGKWYYVIDGKKQNVTGLVQCIQPGTSQGKWYYVENGKQKKFTGIAVCRQVGSSSNGKKYYVEDGKLKKVTGIFECKFATSSSSTASYYVKDGRYQEWVSGEVEVDGKKYIVKNGKYYGPNANGFVDKWASQGDPTYPRTLYMVENGKIANYTGTVVAYIICHEGGYTGMSSGGILVELNVKNGKVVIQESDLPLKKVGGEVVDDQAKLATDGIMPIYIRTYKDAKGRWGIDQELLPVFSWDRNN